MAMSWIYLGIITLSMLASALLGNGGQLAGAITEGAKAGVELAISLAGSICLWTGVGALMERNGMTHVLGKLLQPMLGKIFPSSRKDPKLRSSLSANVCANFLGLGNAATPMGIRAAQRMAGSQGIASDELCRLIVLNTASIQLIPANIAALRSSLGCSTPFDILPAVWVSSLCSAGLGLGMAWLLSKVCRHG